MEMLGFKKKLIVLSVILLMLCACKQRNIYCEKSDENESFLYTLCGMNDHLEKVKIEIIYHLPHGDNCYIEKMMDKLDPHFYSLTDQGLRYYEEIDIKENYSLFKTEEVLRAAYFYCHE